MEEEAKQKQRQWGVVPSWPFAHEAVDQHRLDDGEEWLWPPKHLEDEEEAQDGKESEDSEDE
eukprot:4734554-Karenia_brevis.AAC.1